MLWNNIVCYGSSEVVIDLGQSQEASEKHFPEGAGRSYGKY